jgi:tol-pal system protein YbgF
MRIRTHGVATAAALALMSACASAPVQSVASTTTANAELTALRTQQLEQTRRIAELEARLALLEADARHVRDDSGPSLRTGETLRIGAPASEPTSRAAPPQEPARPESTEDADEGKRPSLRLYGNSSSGGTVQRASLPAVPVVNERLPVAPLPEQRAAKTLRGTGAAAPEGGTEPYRKGLRALQERRYDDALTQFAAFLAEHPRHEMAASALYWRGEALYAKREYSAARKEFETLLERYPGAPRTPDALLKLGLSLRKLGDREQADQALERLRTDFPHSQAAEAAVGEGST